MALRALPRCWAHLVGLLAQVTLYLELITLIQTYSTLFIAIGGRDGMDAGGTHWMTHSNYRTCHQSWLSERFLAVGRIWWGFWLK